MTENLSRLLSDAARDVAVPHPPARDIVHAGRRRRRRRAGAAAGGVALATALVLGGVLLVPGAGDRAVDPVGPDPSPAEVPTFDGVTYAIGDQVFLDGGESSVTVDDRAVKSLYYSSAGIVVRHGEDSFSDGGGPQRFTLVRPDGTTSPISVETEENAHGVDPGQPYLAWTEAVSGGVEVVVHDVDTDTEVARVEVPGRFEWSPPPVALSGDTVYVGGRPGDGATLLAVDWRTGEVTDSGVAAYFPEVSGGRTVQTVGSPLRPRTQVIDVADGAELYNVTNLDRNREVSLRLSPSGSSVVSTATSSSSGEERSDVFALRGDPSPVDPVALPPGDLGWSASEQPFAVDGDTVTVCSPPGGTCESRTRPELEDGDAEVLLGGVLYES